MFVLSSIIVLLSVFSWRAEAVCQSFGVDYSPGGSYQIDVGSNDYFTFVTFFLGCSQEVVQPLLVSPSGSQYSCSNITTTPDKENKLATCYIPFSQMTSGDWTIELHSNSLTVKRTFYLTVGAAQTITTTQNPTVVIGVTTTLSAVTAYSTVYKTETLIEPGGTVTSNCGASTTLTVTSYLQLPTVTTRQTLTRTQTDGQTTIFSRTTATSTASCHLPNKIKREEAVYGAVGATTVTVIGTKTQTSTEYFTVPGTTTTEIYLDVTTLHVTPPPSTVCVRGAATATVTLVPGGAGTITHTDIVYVTSHATGTVYVGETTVTTLTNSASASACWRAGGWYGR